MADTETTPPEEAPEAEKGEMFTEGGKPGPGRPKGALSKRQIADRLKVSDVLERMQYDPIAALIEESRKEEDPEKRKQIALTILPYVYSRQPAVVESAAPEGEDGAPAQGLAVRIVL